jgi:hypothetical protein
MFKTVGKGHTHGCFSKAEMLIVGEDQSAPPGIAMGTATGKEASVKFGMEHVNC